METICKRIIIFIPLYWYLLQLENERAKQQASSWVPIRVLK